MYRALVLDSNEKLPLQAVHVAGPEDARLLGPVGIPRGSVVEVLGGDDEGTHEDAVVCPFCVREGIEVSICASHARRIEERGEDRD